MVSEHFAGSGRTFRGYHVGVWILYAAVTVWAYGPSLRYGLALDDHWHQDRIAKMGWSIGEMLDATTLDPEEMISSWWQEHPVRWRYARPFSVFLMKVVHALFDDVSFALHALSVVMHVVIVAMVHQLCLLLTRHRFWSVVGGLLFVVYSHSVFAVSWPAAQNTLLQTGLTLGALLCYVRASGLNVYSGPRHPHDASSNDGASDVPRLGRGAMAWVMVLWVLALLSRENAVVFPAILVAFDLAYGGRRHVWARRGVYACMGVVGVGYAVWRLAFFYLPIPEVYLHRPDGDGYALWWMAKLLHYLCSALWLSPMVIGPTGRFHPFQDVPRDCLLMIGILAVLGTGYYQASRKARGYWIWPLWLVLSILPVVPILATPHSGYLCAVSFSVGLVLAAGLGVQVKPIGLGRTYRLAPLAYLFAMCVYLPLYRSLWEAMIASERLTVAEMTSDRPPEGVTDIFFLNLPYVNIYAPIGLQEAWGDSMAGVRCHVLTHSPDLTRMSSPCTLRILDAHSFTLSTQGRGYFSGLLGRFLIEGMRGGGRFATGDESSTDLFDVKMVRASAQGVSELQFTFREPLTSDRYRFYLSTTEHAGLRLNMGEAEPEEFSVDKSPVSLQNVTLAADALSRGRATAAETLFSAMDSSDAALRQASWEKFARVAGPVAVATAATTQDLLGNAMLPNDWRRVRDWWRRRVTDRIVDRVWVRRDVFAKLRRRRERLAEVRAVTAGVIRTDLYLSGPPFPGPR